MPMNALRHWIARLDRISGVNYWIGDRRARLLLMGLTLLVFCLSLFTATDYLLKRQKMEVLGVGHDTFVLVQTYRELDRFLSGLRRYASPDVTEDPIGRDELILRFELLASRVPLLTEGQVGNRLRGQSGMRELARELSDSLARIEPQLERLGRPVRSAEYELIRADLAHDREELYTLIRDFLIQSEAHEISLLDDYDGYASYGYVAAVVLSGILLVAVYGTELKRTMRSSARLAEEGDQLREAREELSYQATHDGLTGLINRVEFDRRLHRVFASAQSSGTEGALLFIDMDRFKTVNDSCGHFAGDQLLRQIGSLLGGRVRKRDTLARVGGDEFAVLLEHCSLPEAMQVAEDIREVVRKFRFVWEGKAFELGLSAGVAAVTAATESPAAAFRAADDACYTAKGAGRNCIHLYAGDSGAPMQKESREACVARIEQSLESGRLHLFRQTILPLGQDDAQGECFEIFLRLEDEEGVLMVPEAFLPNAERYDLMTALDRWVIGKTFAWFSSRPGRLDTLGACFINLSAHSLKDPEIREFIAAHLELHKIPPVKICFEIAEVVAVANLSRAIEFMEPLHKLGVRFALDNFGSGASSFAYLKHLPVDYIKIDGALVKDIAKNATDRALVKAIHDVASVMEKGTIAECVEDGPILEVLRRIQVDFVQGFAIDLPCPLEGPDALKLSGAVAAP